MKNPTDEKTAFKVALVDLVTAAAKAIVQFTLVLSALALVLMVLVHFWHNTDPAIPSIGFGEAMIVVVIGRFLTSPPAKSAK